MHMAGGTVYRCLNSDHFRPEFTDFWGSLLDENLCSVPSTSINADWMGRSPAIPAFKEQRQDPWDKLVLN